MGHLKHIGRVGALAIALGVGSAVAAMPAIASAAPSDSGNATANASPASDSPSASASSASNTTTASGASQPKFVQRSINAPRLAVPVSGGVHTSGTSADDADAGISAVVKGSGADTNGVRVGSGRGRDPGAGNRHVATALNNPAPESRTTTAAAPRLTSTTLRDVQSALDRATPFPAGATSDEPNAVPAPAAQSVLPRTVVAPTGLSAALVRVASSLATAGPASSPATDPEVPVLPSPDLLMALAWTGREIGGVGPIVIDPDRIPIFIPIPDPRPIPDPVPDPVPEPAKVAVLEFPDLTDPISVLTFVHDLVVAVNVLIARSVNIYDFGDWRGWTAFLLDYTWGLPGTTLGAAVNVINLFWPGANYRDDLSYHQNHHVYEGGFHVMGALGIGNVISNAGYDSPYISMGTLQHEDTHVWESRLFGPLMEITYVSWMAAGLILGTIAWLSDTRQDWYTLVYRASYWNNPWEVWARASE